MQQVDKQNAKLAFIFKRFAPQLLKFSRRSKPQLGACHAVDASKRKQKLRITQFVEAKRAYQHGSVINFSPTNTVEIRIFRGTLCVPTLYAAIELTDYMVNFIKQYTLSKITRMNWKRFLQEIDSLKYPNLVAYLIKRKLWRGDKPACALSSPKHED